MGRALAAALALSTAEAWACLCSGEPSRSAQMERATHVYVGRVVAVTGGQCEATADVEVLNVIKGGLKPKDHVSIASGCFCNFEYSAGQTWIFVSAGAPNAIDICGGSHRQERTTIEPEKKKPQLPTLMRRNIVSCRPCGMASSVWQVSGVKSLIRESRPADTVLALASLDAGVPFWFQSRTRSVGLATDGGKWELTIEDEKQLGGCDQRVSFRPCTAISRESADGGLACRGAARPVVVCDQKLTRQMKQGPVEAFPPDCTWNETATEARCPLAELKPLDRPAGRVDWRCYAREGDLVTGHCIREPGSQ